MTGETDLEAMLATLSVRRRPGRWVYASAREPMALGDPRIAARIDELEGPTVVVEHSVAIELALDWEFESAWLTLDVHSSLDAVGLTAAVSAALADCGIPCNVLAGRFHDHLLVPLDRADEAIRALESLRGAT